MLRHREGDMYCHAERSEASPRGERRSFAIAQDDTCQNQCGGVLGQQRVPRQQHPSAVHSHSGAGSWGCHHHRGARAGLCDGGDSSGRRGKRSPLLHRSGEILRRGTVPLPRPGGVPAGLAMVEFPRTPLPRSGGVPLPCVSVSRHEPTSDPGRSRLSRAVGPTGAGPITRAAHHVASCVRPRPIVGAAPCGRPGAGESGWHPHGGAPTDRRLRHDVQHPVCAPPLGTERSDSHSWGGVHCEHS